jgi:hypothetical protein
MKNKFLKNNDFNVCAICINTFNCYQDLNFHIWKFCEWSDGLKSGYKPITREEALSRLLFNETGFSSFDARSILKEYLKNEQSLHIV